MPGPGQETAGRTSHAEMLAVRRQHRQRRLESVQSRCIDATPLIAHRFMLTDVGRTLDAFGKSPATQALKVSIEG